MSDYSPQLSATDRRVAIVGGPMAGKSTLARQLRQAGHPTFCADPRPSVRQPEPDVTYLPNDVDWTSASTYVATAWLTMPGPWVIEGHAMARALRKTLTLGGPIPDRILVLPSAHPAAYRASAQDPLAQAVAKVWDEIAPQLSSVTSVLTIEEASPPWSPLDALRSLGMTTQ